ncbi:MAG: hypothetical protein ACM3XM_06735 [Mycobacterium leprae]
MPDPIQPSDRAAPAGSPGLLEIGLLLAQFQQAVSALTELMAALRTLPQRSPVHMDIASMAVERLDFHLPAIDVESLSGELNVGITHKVEQPRSPEPARAEPPAAPTAPAMATATAVVRGLPHSPVSRWLAAGRPRREDAPKPGQPQPATAPDRPAPPVRPAMHPIWPPKGREGEPLS